MGEPQRCPQDAPDGQDAVIRLWMPGSAPGGRGGRDQISSEMTLSEFVRAYYKPVYLVTRDSRPRNLEEIEQSVKYWVRFTGDPPLGAITVYHGRDFFVGLKALPGRRYATMGNNSVRKHCGAIQAILDLCGPHSRDNREGVGLLESQSVPYLARPPKDETRCEDCFTLDEMARLSDHADAAWLPAGLPCSAAVYFRRAFAVDYNTGIRPNGLMLCSWRHFHGDHLILPARIVAKGHRDQRVELNSAASAAIEAMRGFDAERIFPWPRKWPGSKGQLYEQLAAIRAAAGFPPDRQFAFKGIRRLHTNEMVEINPHAVQKSLGHTTGRISVENYTSRKVVAAAVARLPVLRSTRDRQQRLFD